MIIKAIVFILIFGYAVSAYKILVLYPTPAHSHQAPILALTEGLIKKGHELYVLSPARIPELANNYTHIDLLEAYGFFSDQMENESLTFTRQMSTWEVITKFIPAYAEIPAKQFKSEPFLKFQKRVKDEKLVFDVVIVESGFMPILCGMSRHLAGRAPIIGLSTFVLDILVEEGLGSIAHLSYLPSIGETHSDRMDFGQKVTNWLSLRFLYYLIKSTMEKSAAAYFQEAHGPGGEAIIEGCYKNASLTMLASNFLYYYPRLLSPNVIELGPLHMKPPGKLPKVLEDWLDGAEKGVIYFNMGTNMKSKFLPETARSNLLKFFREALPAGYRVLWKWELDGPIPGQSDNILTQKWFPQQTVLAHPKIKLFITQGGLQSFQETVHYGVPTVGIPWGADQLGSVGKMVHSGIGVLLTPRDLNSYYKVKTAIETVLYNESFSKNMKQLSAVSREFTAQSLDKGIFWVEHVARHGGAPHLRPATADTTLFQFFCLDILLVVLVTSLGILYLSASLLKRLMSVISSSIRTKIKKC